MARWELPVSQGAWLRLLIGALALSAAGLVYWYVFGRVDALLGAEAPAGTRGFAIMGGAGLAASALLVALRPRSSRGPALAVMPCGGAMTEAAFAPGSSYGYCSKRCVHSREDFEARRL